MNRKFKPGQLVRVTHQDSNTESGRRHYIGQTIGFPTPEGTIRVRVVPDMPSTIAELPVEAIEIVSGMRYVQFAVISGRGSFPVDMLRYDSCVPLNFRIETDEHGSPRAILDEGQTEMMIADVTESYVPRWTVERWSSFLWGCRHHSTKKIGTTA